jgi:imidazolonepropionase-like amidohydrolase
MVELGQRLMSHGGSAIEDNQPACQEPLRYTTDIAMASTRIGYRLGWLIDGTGKPAAQNRIITIAAGRFEHIMDGNDLRANALTIVDLSACTAMPALIDSHVHLAMSGTTEPARRRYQLESQYAERQAIIAEHLQRHLTCGVCAVRDGGDHNGDTLRYKLDPTHTHQSPVTIAAAGRARHAAGRYGKLIGVAVPPQVDLTLSAFGTKSRRDHLKLVNSGLNSLTQFGVETPAQFEQEDLKRAIADATDRGLPTMVHANGRLPVKLAVEARCTSIEHGFFMGRENLQRMADNGVFWVPTAVTMKAYSDYLNDQGHRSDPSFAQVSQKNLQHQLEQIATAWRMGVTLALGTDAGSPGVHHGLAVWQELQLFVAAGLGVTDAIRCASRNGALLMGHRDRGEIVAGMRADWIAVNAVPEDVPQALHETVFRMIDGRVIGDPLQPG